MTAQGVDGSEKTAEQLHRLAVASAAVDTLIASRLGVSATDYAALKHIMAAEVPIGPGRLARLLGMTSGSATVLVDRLVAGGHLVRVQDKKDRRRVALQASSATVSQVADELEPLVVMVAELSGSFDRSEQAAIQRFIGLLAGRYADHAERSHGRRRVRSP